MTTPSDYRGASSVTRADRAASLDVLHEVEEALAAPSPGREPAWLDGVLESLERLAQLLETHGHTDAETDSLLSQIARDEPRFAGRIDRLRDEAHDLRASIDSLRSQLSPTRDDVDVADIRDRLSAVARRYRQHRAREADLIYEAVLVDLGGPG